MCPESGHPLVRRYGRYGPYVACSGYPQCRYKPPKPVRDTGVLCPKDGGVIAERRGRFRPFYGCVNYPNCDFTLSARPIPEACPKCGNPYLLLRERKSGSVLACDNPSCGFEKAVGTLPEIREVIIARPPGEPAAKGKKKKKEPAPALAGAETPEKKSPDKSVPKKKASRTRAPKAKRAKAAGE